MDSETMERFITSVERHTILITNVITIKIAAMTYKKLKMNNKNVNKNANKNVRFCHTFVTSRNGGGY